MVLSAVLRGRVAPGTLGLDPKTFWRPLHQGIFSAALACEEMQQPIGVELIGRNLARQGGGAERLADELLTIVAAPWCASVESSVTRIRKLAAERELIGEMQRIDASCRVGLGVPRKQARLVRQLLAAHEERPDA